MNYGKFFRLNQNVSKIEDGVAIFDYIDLPAYFEKSTEVKMSAKYPINVTITEERVQFRVHYSAFEIKTADTSNYVYDVLSAYSGFSLEASKEIRHMEEVILELPFKDDSTDHIYHAIKKVYSTPFPSRNDDFLHHLIQARYITSAKDKEEDKSPIAQLYQTMHLNLDGDRSYSTLWLMELSQGEKYLLEIEAGVVTRFLRKLLLDFMFDLKHSDVFQTSKYYQAMYSGLMSSFYFSTLMHKCEYYFYRGLIRDLIKTDGINDEDKKKHLKGLYVDNLIDAETLWTQDIMSHNSDKYFEFCYTADEDKGKQSVNSFYSFRCWNSWFASPEEEMRRVCFTMKEENNNEIKPHICNSEVIREYLEKTKYKLEEEQKRKIENNKTKISRWFLRRYSIGDVLHLHLVKHTNTILFPSLFTLLMCIFIFPRFFDLEWWQEQNAPIPWLVVIVAVIALIVGTLYIKERVPRSPKWPNETDVLYTKRRSLIWKRVGALITMSFAALTLFISSTFIIKNCDVLREDSSLGTLGNLCLIFLMIILFVLIGIGVNKCIYHIHWLSNMHVFLPRLLASITAAWITLAIGSALFGTFFDSIVSWTTSISLTIIVFAFVMYEINKLLPREEIINKLLRCCGIMLTSYMISIIIGLFIINFTGERFLERSGVLEDFYQDYVNQEVSKQVENRQYRLTTYPSRLLSSNCVDSVEGMIHIPVVSLKDSVVNQKELKVIFLLTKKDNKYLSNKQLLEGLESVHIVNHPTKETTVKSNHPLVTTWDLGHSKFFILRDFLIQFAFVAMFIGIFIQMLFEEKSITET